MSRVPKFLLYGQDDATVEEEIQPTLALREWSDLRAEEKQISFQELENSGWIGSYSTEILGTIEYLNHNFLRLCPGKNLHSVQPASDYRGGFGNDSERMRAAIADFQHILLHESSSALVMRMLSQFAQSYIDGYSYRQAAEAKTKEDKDKYLKEAFEKFDPLSNCLNHIFEQFSINQILTRNGFVPRQDKKIIDEIYIPTLKILADPKWKTVSDSLVGMFEDYRERNYSETITKAHSSVQRFLQVLVGEEGKSGKGEVGKLFSQAKLKGIIPANRFTEPIVTVFQGYITSERATNSTAKPALKTATALDALLMMNVVMVFLQFCLQKTE